MDRDTDAAQGDGELPGRRQGIQPAVSVEDLDQFRRTKESRRLARLEADTELMLRLAAEGFDSIAWRKVAQALVEYGFTVMRAWVVTGQVFVKLREKGRQVPDPPLAGIPRTEALVLAEDTVADAIVHFRDNVLKQGYWDPAKGASLTTFFIGNCLMFQFPNLYRRWRNDHINARRTVSIHADEGEQDHHPVMQLPTTHDPAAEVVGADETKRSITEILEPIGDQTNKAILLLRGEGFGIDEIAETLGLPYGVIESRIYRARKTLRRRKGA